MQWRRLATGPASRIRLPSVFQWTDRESNPDFRHARAVSSRWTISPYSVDRRGIEPRSPGCKPSRLPVGRAAHIVKRSVRESNPVFRPYHGACCRNTYRPCCASDPGWNRTSTFLDVTQASSPLDHGIMFSDRGGSRTHKITRLSTCSLCLFAYPVMFKWRVRGSHPAVQAYEARMSTGPPASSCRSRYRAGRTGRMKASWTPVAPAMFK